MVGNLAQFRLDNMLSWEGNGKLQNSGLGTHLPEPFAKCQTQEGWAGQWPQHLLLAYSAQFCLYWCPETVWEVVVSSPQDNPGRKPSSSSPWHWRCPACSPRLDRTWAQGQHKPETAQTFVGNARQKCCRYLQKHSVEIENCKHIFPFICCLPNPNKLISFPVMLLLIILCERHWICS